VLVEPDINTYKSFIDPLLEQIDSRYRHVPKLSDLIRTSEAEVLPDQLSVTSKMISKGTINDTLLILANLTGVKAIQPKHGSSIIAMHHYINGMMNQENSFHHYGIVRMIAWLPDNEKAAYIPRNITERKSFTVRLDSVAQVAEIAGVDEIEDPPQSRRKHDLTIKSKQLASQRARYFSLWDPENRRPHPPTCPWHEIGFGSDELAQLRRLPNKLSWQVEMLALDDAWNARPVQSKHQSGKAKGESGRPRSEVPETLRFHRTKFLTIRKAHLIAQKWASRQGKLDKAESDLIAGNSTSSKHAAKSKGVQATAAELYAEMAKGRRDLVVVARKYIDDRRGFDQDPPLLQWDRRTAEPLVVKEEEFYPPKKLALLDIKPVSEALDKLDNFDKRVCFDYLCNMLFRNPARSIRNDLTTIVQGGLDDFVQQVPDLLNPSKGGHPNLDDLRARTIPVSLLVQLALVLERWPFRRQTHEMIMSRGRKKRSMNFEEQ
jgi:mitochondrial transcription factor 1